MQLAAEPDALAVLDVLQRSQAMKLGCNYVPEYWRLQDTKLQRSQAMKLGCNSGARFWMPLPSGNCNVAKP